MRQCTTLDENGLQQIVIHFYTGRLLTPTTQHGFNARRVGTAQIHIQIYIIVNDDKIDKQ